MGNTTNTEQWAAMERLRFIERAWCLENGAYYESGVRGQRSAVGGRWSVDGVVRIPARRKENHVPGFTLRIESMR